MSTNKLDQYIPTVTDLSDWTINLYANTGGSRAKRIASEPVTDDLYFVKGSKVTKDGEIRYPTEFWSEIVSSKVGQYLGFNMLDYNIAYNTKWDQKVGCLSKSMVKHSENKLTEGKAYLTGFNAKYVPETDKKDYTFQFIEESLNFFSLQEHLPKLVEMIIFDAIIGNSDRHQENWGFINYFHEAIESYEEQKSSSKNVIKRFLFNLVTSYLKFVPKDKEDIGNVVLQSAFAPSNFSPIYDSGCCLGRELLDNKVINYIRDDNALNNYIKKGRSEIHWKGNLHKQNHFDLITLLKHDYKDIINETISKVQNRFNEQDICNIVNNIDLNTPKELEQHKLTPERKKLMIKIITLRTQKLFELK